MARPRKNDPRNERLSLRIKQSDVDFIAAEMQRTGKREGAIAYSIFECGRRLYFAECSNKTSNNTAENFDGGAS
jgi:hypothetical protein